MENLCSACKKNKPGKPRMIQFEHQKLVFTIFKDGLTCEKCVIKEHKKLFDEYGKNLITLENSHITVNWKLFCEKDRTAREGTFSIKEINAMADILRSLGIFSLMSNSNWSIISDEGILLNPRPRLSAFFFTREEDVKAYARIELAGTLYNWVLLHTDKIISKQAVLKEKT